MLPTNLGDRAIAAQPGQHDLDLLLRRPTPVLPLLTQPLLPSVERPMLSRPPDSPSGATRLQDCPAPQPSHLSTQARGAGQVWEPAVLGAFLFGGGSAPAVVDVVSRL